MVPVLIELAQKVRTRTVKPSASNVKVAQLP